MKVGQRNHFNYIVYLRDEHVVCVCVVISGFIIRFYRYTSCRCVGQLLLSAMWALYILVEYFSHFC